MKTLVIYRIEGAIDRASISEHLYSFFKYADAKSYYLNVAYGVPEYIFDVDFDLIVFHNTFLALRWADREILDRYYRFKRLKGYKIALPQDEFLNTESLNKFFINTGVKTVFTCLPESEFNRVYPKDKSGLDYCFTIFPGYIDDSAMVKASKYCRPHKLRTIDTGYRAWKAPYWLGRHGQLKWQLTEKFLNTSCKSNLNFDLSNNEKHVFHGEKWYEFLSNCRVVLGCEGGASLLDADGSIKRKTEQYVRKHPHAAFEDVEKACFPGLDGNLKLFALSPRHFEACITRTCQALVEGEYGGILKPGVHYIEIKKDWSNIQDVIKQVADKEYCERIANNAYTDIVESGLYTYKRLVGQVVEHVKRVSIVPIDSTYAADRNSYRLQLREKYPYVYAGIPYVISHLRYFIYRLLLRINLYTSYKNIEAILRQDM